MVTHEKIEEHQWVDLYVMGRLSESERASFEDHFMACETCLEAIELATAFQRDLKREAVRDFEASFAATLMARLLSARVMRTTSVLLAAALLFVVLLPGPGNVAGRLTPARVVTLEVVRSEDPFAANRIALAPGTELVLSDQMLDPSFAVLRITLTDPAGAPVFQSRLPGSRESLGLNLGVLTEGRYLLQIEGGDGTGNFELFAEYGFEIVAP